MSQPQYILEYFGIRGRAEYIRLILEEVGATYDEVVVARPKWDTDKINKDNYPFHQVPKLTDNALNLPLVQSNAICRHLSRKYNLYGKTIEEQAKTDMYADAGEDLRVAYNEAMYCSGDYNEAVKELHPQAQKIMEELEYQLKKK